MSNFLKNLHPLLRRKKNSKDNEDVNFALLNMLDEEMNLIEKDAIESKLQSSLKTATGKYLDNFGDWFGVYRRENETDDKYRARIIKYLLLKRGTNNAIIDAIRDYLEDEEIDVTIYEPFKNIFYTNKSHLNGEDHLMGYYYRFAIINVTVGGYFPVEIVDVINEFKPAGVKFYVTYDGAGTIEGDAVIKLLDDPINIDVYQNIDRLSGYSEMFFGHVNMGLRKVEYNSDVNIFRTNRSKINSSDVLTGSSSIGRAFHNYAYKTSYIYTPRVSSTVAEISTVLGGKGRELPLEYYINTTEKDKTSVSVDTESTTGASFIYNHLNLREYFNEYKPELLIGDTREVKNKLTQYIGEATLDLYMGALIPPERTIAVQTQIYDFSINRWVTIKNSNISYGLKNIGADLGYIKDYMNDEFNVFTRISVESPNSITLTIDYLDLLFYHYTPDVYTVKPYKGLIEYYISLDSYSYVEAYKVPSLDNGDIISKVGYEPMGYVRIVSDTKENKDIKIFKGEAYTGTRYWEHQILSDVEDVISTKKTRYLVEFDIFGEDEDLVRSLYASPMMLNRELNDFESDVYYNEVFKVSLNGKKGRVIIDIPTYVDLNKYPNLIIAVRTFDYVDFLNSNQNQPYYADEYKIGFKNVTVQDIYESTDKAPDPTTISNRAFTDTRVIDATPSRGNSAQDGNILGNEAYSLKSPANYDNSKYEILTDLSLRKPIEAGKTYTIQLKGKLGSDRPYWYVYNSNGSFNELYGQSPLTPDNYDPKTGIYTKTFVAPEEDYEHPGVNLLKPYKGESEIYNSIESTKEFTFGGWGQTLYKGTYISEVTEPGKEYTLTFDMEIVGVSEEKLNQKGYGLRLYDRDKAKDAIVARYDLPREIGQKKSVSVTFTMPEGNYDIIGYSSLLSPDGTLDSFPRDFDELKITNLKLELGNQKTPWSEAPNTLPGKSRKRLNRNIRIYQAPNTGTSKSTIEWVKIEEGSQATVAGYNFGYYTLVENLPKGEYDIYYKAKLDVLQGDLDMLTILDHPNSTPLNDPKYLVPIDKGYVKGKLSVNRESEGGRVILYAGLAGATAGNKVRFSDLEIYFSTDEPEYTQNEIILRDSEGGILETTRVDSDYTTTNSVYNGLKTYNHTVMLYGSYTNIAEIEVRGTGELSNAKLQYTRYNIPSSWNTLEEIKKLTPTGEPFSLKYENKLRDLYGLQLIDYSELNAMSTVKLKSIWETTIGELTETEGSFSDMPRGYFNAVWQVTDRLDDISRIRMEVLDYIAGGMIDNSVQEVLKRHKAKVKNYTDLSNYSEVYNEYTEEVLVGSPRRIEELRNITMAEDSIEVDNRTKVVNTHSEQGTNTNILKNSYETRTIVGSGFAEYELKEPIKQRERYNLRISGNFKEGLERLAIGNSSGSFNEVFVYPEDIKNGYVDITYTSRDDNYAEGKQRLNNDYRVYVQPYTSDTSTIYSIELRKV